MLRKSQIRHIYSKLFVNLLFLPDSLRKKKNHGTLELIKPFLAETTEIEGIKFDAFERGNWARGELLKVKEPDTLRWLDCYVKPGETFYDVGANVGVFTLYAALKRQAHVVAFEPESMSYSLLNRNIFHNRLDSKATAFNIALHSQNKASILNLVAFRPGGGTNTFVEARDALSEPFKPAFIQGSIGMTLDHFVFELNQLKPNHIKIDVDGNEGYVIAGMKKTLTDPCLKSLAIEVNESLEVSRQIIQVITENGFKRLPEIEKYRNPAHQGVTFRNLFFARI